MLETKKKRIANKKRARQFRVIRDKVAGVPVAVTAKREGVSPMTVARDRATHDEELDQFRREIFSEFRELAKSGLRKGLSNADSGILNGWMKGMQVYQEKSEVDVNANLTFEQLEEKRKLALQRGLAAFNLIPKGSK